MDYNKYKIEKLYSVILSLNLINLQSNTKRLRNNKFRISSLKYINAFINYSDKPFTADFD